MIGSLRDIAHLEPVPDAEDSEDEVSENEGNVPDNEPETTDDEVEGGMFWNGNNVTWENLLRVPRTSTIVRRECAICFNPNYGERIFTCPICRSVVHGFSVIF